MTDYSKFKTPFVEVSIGDAKGNNLKPLPPQIARLIEKVEIMETLCCNSFNQITITFNEGSREPYQLDDGSFASSDIYSTSGDGNLSNQSGSLVDLRITSKGFTSVFPGTEVIEEVLESVLDLISGGSPLKGKDNTPPEPIVKKESKPSSVGDITYLLQQRNQVKVTWGYREDVSSFRSVRGYIMVVTSEFPERGTPKTTIVCHDSAGIADQVTTKQGKNLGLEVEAGQDEKGNTLFDYKDLEPKELIEKLCKENGLKCIVSDSFKTPQYEDTRSTHWTGGESLHQFFTRMARRYNAVYKLLIDPSTGSDIIVFINDDEWQKYPVRSDDTLFTYRGNGSIIKSINIKADFGQGIGVFLKSINEEGGETSVESKTVKMPVGLFEANQDNDPLNTNVSGIAQFADKLSNGGVAANVAISAESSPSSLEGRAGSETDRKSSVIAMDFTTLGFPKLTPGNVKFGGIGKRYSGFYNVQSVTHTIDSQGYSCKGIATSFKNAEGGVKPDAPQETIEEKKVKVQLFEAEPAPSGSAKQEYNKTFINNGQGSSSSTPEQFRNIGFDGIDLGI